jgi:alkyl sulfatase BDS1-like metallo-beta-lactamase superfamily hydrolase
MKGWPVEKLARAVDSAGEELRSVIQGATPDHMRATVDVGFARLPLWQATYISLSEAVYHGWDARVGRNPEATIDTPWALQLALGMEWFAPQVAHRTAATTGGGRYLLRIGDEIGPMTVVVQDDNVALLPGEAGQADAALTLTADQFVRMIAGRLDLGRLIERRAVEVEGDTARVAVLQRIFHGIANGD